MREVDLDNSANYNLRDNRRQEDPSNSSVAASRAGAPIVERQENVLQYNYSPENHREDTGAANRNVQIRDNRNQTLEAGDIFLICGDVHTRKLIYPEFQPREVVGPFVGAAVPRSAFFVIPDIRNAAPAKKMHQAVVEVVEGDATANQIENEFTQWVGNTCTWRFYAKPMSAKKFLMRFPSAKDIDAWIHFGKTNMRTAILLSKWIISSLDMVLLVN
jgi:hypothetical protein